MATKLIEGNIWDDPDFESYDPLRMLMFIYLFSSQRATHSGIYSITPKRIADTIQWPRALVEVALGIADCPPRDELRKMILEVIDRRDGWLDRMIGMSSLKNIFYDNANFTVFVKNALAQSQALGGNREWINDKITQEHDRTKRATQHWDMWRKIYREYISASKILTKHFLDKDEVALADQPNVDEAKPPPKAAGAKVAADAAGGDTEQLVQTMLNRYTSELETDDRDLVFRVIKHVTTNLHTGKPLAKKQQLIILKRLATEPSILVANACHTFIETDCMNSGKRANYLYGIIRNSATSWFIETRNEMEKAGEKLGPCFQKPARHRQK